MVGHTVELQLLKFDHIVELQLLKVCDSGENVEERAQYMRRAYVAKPKNIHTPTMEGISCKYPFLPRISIF